MFSRKEQLIQRTGKDGVGRYDFLKLLVTEFQTITSKEAKKQVLANLANFAYDPVNYEYLRNLRVIDLFLNTLSEKDEALVQFAISGLCNLCLDPLNKEYILRNQAIQLISSLLSSPSSNQETICSSITTLIFLSNPSSKEEITKPEIRNQMQQLAKSQDKRVSNLARIFLRDLCDEEMEEKFQEAKA